MLDALKRLFLGNRKDFRDPGIFHRMALIPFLAWVGLGADGLSSSSYGPAEAFKELGEHRYLAVGLALATAFTVIVISASYSQIVDLFPSGGGGYLVASRLLGPRWGLISGSALLVDYVLTIATSVAAGVDAVFSFMPDWVLAYKVSVAVAVILLIVLMNVRGVKESVVALMPVFIIFLITHAVLILVAVLSNVSHVGAVTRELSANFHRDLSTPSFGWAGMLFLFLRAYSLGGGTYTGIEAVSNGLAIMREPRRETGKRTMLYMAVSLSVTAGGILLSYLLLGVATVEQAGKTMNAVLAERVASNWHIGPVHLGEAFIITTLVSEGALLFVAAQAGFIDGPRVMSNMANDSWLPHRFGALSNRLTTQNGVLLMGVAAIAALVFTRGNVSALLVLYAINVFLTFSLSQLGMVRYWFAHRRERKDWLKHMPINLVGLVMCVTILIVTIAEKFAVGGYLTLIVTGIVVALCLLIRRHYATVRRALSHLDKLFSEIPTNPKREELGPCDPARPTAALLVTNYGGVGVHSMLTLLKMFPNQFTNIVFLSVGQIDSGNFKGRSEVATLKRRTKDELGRYVGLARRLGLSATYRFEIGTDVVEEVFKMCQEVIKEFPKTIFFSGKLIFEDEAWYHRILHNETAYQIQHRLQFAGHAMFVLPVRVRAKELDAASTGADPFDTDQSDE